MGKDNKKQDKPGGGTNNKQLMKLLAVFLVLAVSYFAYTFFFKADNKPGIDTSTNIDTTFDENALTDVETRRDDEVIIRLDDIGKDNPFSPATE